MTDLLDPDEPEFTPSRSGPGDPFGEFYRNWGRRIRTEHTPDPAGGDADSAHEPRGPDRDDGGG